MFRKNQKTLVYFLKLTHKLSKTYLIKSVLASVTKALTPFFNIIMPKLIIDELLGDKNISKLLIYVAVLTIGNLSLKLLNQMFVKIMESAKMELLLSLETYLGEKCVDMDFENIENPDILDLKEKAYFAIYNEDAVGRTVENVSKIINEVITLVGLGYILAILNPVIILAIFGIVFLNSIIFKKIERLRFEDNQKSITDNRAFGYFLRLTSDFSIGKDIRLYQARPLILKKMKGYMDKLLAIYSVQYTQIGKYSGISSINIQMQMILIYGYLTLKTAGKSIGIGSFTMYAGAASGFSTSIMSCINALIEINQLCLYLELFKEFDRIESKGKQGSQTIRGITDYTIEFKKVSFKYPRKEEYALKNISIRITPGEKLSVVGLNGAGKTTFIKLLSGLYEPTKGVILLGGVDIREYRYEEYQKLLSVVFQDFKLLSFSIRENLSISSGMTEEQMRTGLDKAGFSQDLNKLLKGLDTSIYKNFDEEGIEFSGGQAQKLAIARALCKNSPIVILDEPTSALDPLAEYEVYHSFDMLVEGKTAIYISHRLSSTRFSDKIAVFKNGEILEYGTHEELLELKDSLYAAMFQTQAKYYIN